MYLPDALAELGLLLGLGPMAFNEHGLCRLRFDDAHTIDLETGADGRTLHLCGVLGVLPADESTSAASMETLLHANFLGEGTGGGYFALDEERGELLYVRSLDSRSLDLTALAGAVEAFVNFYDGWTRKLAEQGGAHAYSGGAGDIALSPSLRV